MPVRRLCCSLILTCERVSHCRRVHLSICKAPVLERPAHTSTQTMHLLWLQVCPTSNNSGDLHLYPSMDLGWMEDGSRPPGKQLKTGSHYQATHAMHAILCWCCAPTIPRDISKLWKGNDHQEKLWKLEHVYVGRSLITYETMLFLIINLNPPWQSMQHISIRLAEATISSFGANR